MKKYLVAAVLLVAPLAGGCSDPCGDLQDCCEAIAADAGEGVTITCNYEDAEDDACEAAVDQIKTAGGDNLPDECKDL